MASAFDTTLDGLGIKRSDTSSAAMANATGKSSLGQQDFLSLMTAQLRNQDPFEPVDNTQMVAQMAQFSSLAGQQEMNSTLKAIADKLGATSPAEALSWVGRTVLTEGSTAYARDIGGIEAGIELDKDATGVTVTIGDADGNPVRTIEMGKQAAGTVMFDWDGTLANGEPAGTGPYTLSVEARGASGAVPARALVWAPVTSVSLPATGGPVLNLPGIGQVSASAVRRIG
ncbi:flagellar hook assembly protein FlgD [Sphingomonas sp. BGYR3]|uniref:flagellar hook assembly protein FlgD n=1 Tax=Sphingomonas sp. BGYR3 TaxID=2975483 RepID=UPI0021A7B3BF|nr:flagellar hook assembly protein FlgD [Sphingomonas sp. BGYR3]MDG5488977.1 flagellar hook assembly protein FlgD [Sphingomonas sp. BGYR3]